MSVNICDDCDCCFIDPDGRGFHDHRRCEHPCCPDWDEEA